ncbi:hypothetical protein Angca_003712, partial [Angiostrongylus cantonensis]
RNISTAATARNINEIWDKGSGGESTVRTWFGKFRSGDSVLEVKKNHECSNELDEDELKALVGPNMRTTARELAEQLGSSTGRIITYMNRTEKAKNTRR